MASVTVNEAARLVGRSRRGIYRDMASGRLAYKTDRDGHRRIDTSELERVHGPLRMHEAAPPSRATDTDQNGDLIAEIRALRDELAGLREEVAQLRRLPAPETPAAPPQTTPESNPTDDKPVNLFAKEMAALRARRKG
ncbi:helix-turn-helix domain-containing protein [Cobetia sp. 14N.309.X.WAT.E.A4]|uniref:helix-turn-helix domain-containing protein n=1 Tax=Cobetia sp. 14N.309.X.WAT.E.A4 TaxID=2998323 RepID=UPI00339D51A0